MSLKTVQNMADSLSIINPQPKRMPGPELLHQLITTKPLSNNVAIEHNFADGICEQITYSELSRLSNALASKIRAFAGPDDRRDARRFIIPCFLPHSLELYISQLAILKAGGAFCHIPLDAPEERLRFILRDIGAKVLLTIPSLAPRLPRLDAITAFEVDKAELDDCDAELPLVPLRPSDAAYVMWVSVRVVLHQFWRLTMLSGTRLGALEPRKVLSSPTAPQPKHCLRTTDIFRPSHASFSSPIRRSMCQSSKYSSRSCVVRF